MTLAYVLPAGPAPIIKVLQCIFFIAYFFILNVSFSELDALIRSFAI